MTAEKLEILALGVRGGIAEYRPAADTVRQVRDAGGVPVVSWSPGKWWGRRGRVVRALLSSCAPGELAVGDTTLRPAQLPALGLLGLARRQGRPILAGSDALPFAGDAGHLGCYATRLAGPFDEADAWGSLRRLLSDAACTTGVAGRRDGLLRVLRRLQRNSRLAVAA